MTIDEAKEGQRVKFSNEFGHWDVSVITRVIPKTESMNEQDELAIEGSYGSYIRKVEEVKLVSTKGV